MYSKLYIRYIQRTYTVSHAFEGSMWLRSGSWGAMQSVSVLLFNMPWIAFECHNRVAMYPYSVKNGQLFALHRAAKGVALFTGRIYNRIAGRFSALLYIR